MLWYECSAYPYLRFAVVSTLLVAKKCLVAVEPKLQGFRNHRLLGILHPNSYRMCLEVGSFTTSYLPAASGTALQCEDVNGVFGDNSRSANASWQSASSEGCLLDRYVA